jgi:hypothetical protein
MARTDGATLPIDSADIDIWLLHRLTNLAQLIDRRELRSRREVLDHARRQGLDLLRARAWCGRLYGSRRWLKWLRKHVKAFGRTQAWRYMKFAKCYDAKHLDAEQQWQLWRRLQGRQPPASEDVEEQPAASRPRRPPEPGALLVWAWRQSTAADRRAFLAWPAFADWLRVQEQRPAVVTVASAVAEAVPVLEELAALGGVFPSRAARAKAKAAAQKLVWEFLRLPELAEPAALLQTIVNDLTGPGAARVSFREIADDAASLLAALGQGRPETEQPSATR